MSGFKRELIVTTGATVAAGVMPAVGVPAVLGTGFSRVPHASPIFEQNLPSSNWASKSNSLDSSIVEKRGSCVEESWCGLNKSGGEDIVLFGDLFVELGVVLVSLLLPFHGNSKVKPEPCSDLTDTGVTLLGTLPIPINLELETFGFLPFNESNCGIW